MNKLKRTLIIGAGVASIGAAGLATVATTSALTSTDSDSGTSIIDKLVSKFNLNKTEVQAVFDASHEEHQADRAAHRAEALKTALSEGTLTQTQYDYIVAAQKEIDGLMDTAGAREDQTEAQKAAIKEKMGALRDWMIDQDLDMHDLGIGGGRGGHGPRD